MTDTQDPQEADGAQGAHAAGVRTDVIRVGDQGLHVPAADAWIDPWRPVETALITHAHADHARGGSQRYLCSPTCAPLLRARLGDVTIEKVPWGERRRLGDAWISFHPAGHVLGSAQIRVEADGQVWVCTGDFKADDDPSCEPFEVVPCDVLITEATFALPIYRWEPGATVTEDLVRWWHANRAEGRASLVFGYSLGKAQRLLAHLADHVDEPVIVHASVERINRVYRDAGVRLAPTRTVEAVDRATRRAAPLVLAPPGAAGSVWAKGFGPASTAFASGWMRVRGIRRRQGYDRGFVVSDHADWPTLLRVIEATGARRVLATHGRTDVLVRALRARGLDADALGTRYTGESQDGRDDAAQGGDA